MTPMKVTQLGHFHRSHVYSAVVNIIVGVERTLRSHIDLVQHRSITTNHGTTYNEAVPMTV